MAISQLLANDILMAGLRKLFTCEQRMQEESMRNEALGGVDVHRIVQHAAYARAANEFEAILKRNIERLVPPQGQA